LIKTLKLPIIVTKEIQYADAILALSNLVKNNRKLKQISHSKNISIHTIQNNSLLQIAKALRLLTKTSSISRVKDSTFQNKITSAISREFLTPLEETRLVIEDLVITKNIAVDLFPRPISVRKQQHELIHRYQLLSVTVGTEKQKRLRIFPFLTIK